MQWNARFVWNHFKDLFYYKWICDFPCLNCQFFLFFSKWTNKGFELPLDFHALCKYISLHKNSCTEVLLCGLYWFLKNVATLITFKSSHIICELKWLKLQNEAFILWLIDDMTIAAGGGYIQICILSIYIYIIYSVCFSVEARVHLFKNLFNYCDQCWEKQNCMVFDVIFMSGTWSYSEHGKTVLHCNKFGCKC